MQADLLELGEIEPGMRRLRALQRENAQLLERQLRAFEAGDEQRTNEVAGDAFLQKPFSAEELSDAVRASLDHFPSLDHSPSLAA